MDVLFAAAVAVVSLAERADLGPHIHLCATMAQLALVRRKTEGGTNGYGEPVTARLAPR